MTHLGYGTWLNSVVTSQRLPFHFAERGSVDPHLRWCWRTRHLLKVHDHFLKNGIRVSEPYHGPDGKPYFDFWATAEGTRLTAVEDNTLKSKGFKPSFTRIGVRDLREAGKWYQEFVGMKVHEDHSEDGYLYLSLTENFSDAHRAVWMLEQLPSDAYTGKINGPVRPLTLIKNRQDFFDYHRYLQNSGVECGDIGGHLDQGRVLFHFYDMDGNRFNVTHCKPI
ncbi:VOC family protein [Paenibacillus cymbidii]|uniref:VOC family protein n=1 Tax=Paenibacillus cymbidii TaxID=1639034 RepID=UPI0010807B94|nr:VOC family protein [Paenibacillus cymbidii]